jgi:phosphatidate cytidylyltransferase
MLRNRVITSLVLAPLIIAAVYFLQPMGFAVLWGAVILLAAWEWTHLAGLAAPAARAGFVGAILAIQLSAHYWAPYTLDWLFWPVVAWWFVLGLLFRKAADKLLRIRYPVAAKLAAGAFVLVTAWVLMVWLRVNFGFEQVVYLLVLVWLADVAAYFVGKRWGHTKLLEQISPGKTVEGAYGALAATAVLAVSVGLLLGFEPIMIGDFVFLSLVTVLFSICGDLFESFAKRLRGVKDSSGILPGHGGVLDRVDSLLAAVSVFYAGSFLLGIFLQAGSVGDMPIVLQPDAPSTMEIPAEEEDSAPHDGEAH